MISVVLEVQQRSGLKNLILEKKIDTVEEALQQIDDYIKPKPRLKRRWKQRRRRSQNCWRLPTSQPQILLAGWCRRRDWVIPELCNC